jgi:hypothetical protein
MNEPRQTDLAVASDGHRGRWRLLSVAIVVAVALVALFARLATLPAQESGATVAPVPPPGGLALIVVGATSLPRVGVVALFAALAVAVVGLAGQVAWFLSTRSRWRTLNVELLQR